MGPQRRLLAGPVLSMAEPAARAAGLRVLSSTASSNGGAPPLPPRLGSVSPQKRKQALLGRCQLCFYSY